MGGSIFKHDGILGGIFPGFMWDLYRVTLELLRDPNVIILASSKDLRNILIYHSRMKSAMLDKTIWQKQQTVYS